jgi:hypothetical protein
MEQQECYLHQKKSEQKRLVVDSQESPPAVFGDLGLHVKFGPLVTTAEAQCLWLINKYLKDEVHVPEVYIDGGLRATRSSYICSSWKELISIADGISLAKWRGLTSACNFARRCWLCVGLSRTRMMLLSVSRRISALISVYIAELYPGSIDRRPLLFSGFFQEPQPGPFSSIMKFHDYICGLPGRKFDKGWYPDYWDYCRACYISGPWEEWRDCWIPKFLHSRLDVYDIYCELLISFGAF